MTLRNSQKTTWKEKTTLAKFVVNSLSIICFENVTNTLQSPFTDNVVKKNTWMKN